MPLQSMPVAQAREITLPTVDGKIVFEGVVKTDSTLTKQEIYSRAREWLVNSFVSGKAVLQLDDKAEGKIMGDGRTKFTYVRDPGAVLVAMQEFKYQFTIKIEVRDGRYKYQVYNFLIDDDLTYYQGRVILTRHFSFDDFYQRYKQGSAINFLGNNVQDSPASRQKAARDYKGILLLLNTRTDEIITSLNKALTSTGAGKDW